MAITLNGTTGITTPTYGGAVAAEYIAPVTSFKNRIINGDMRIDQRNAGAAVSGNGDFPVDRFRYFRLFVGESVATLQRDTDAPSGFSNSIKTTITTPETSFTGLEECSISHFVEGFNTADLGFGTATAKTVTLSFWVKSSLTGTFGGCFQNSDNSRAYPFSYAISAANTWEYKIVTVAGDTTGTWLTNNGIGIRLFWNLGAGSDKLGTANSWTSSNHRGVTGQVQLAETNGATFYITGVQLEKGSTATSFDYRPYSTELALCQRYYYKAQASTASALFGIGRNVSTTLAFGYVAIPVTMRINPPDLETTGTATDYQVRHIVTSTACSSVPILAATSPMGYVQFTVASGLTAGQACDLRSANSSAFLAWSAEL